MIAVGLGFQLHATEGDIVAAVDSTLSDNDARCSEVGVFATAQFKEGAVNIEHAARNFGVDVLYLEENVLLATKDRLLTHSSHSAARLGVSCLSEAAALAALGEQSRLLAARSIHGPVTCALAIEVLP